MDLKAGPYYQPRIQSIHQLPVEHQRRRITDICCCGLGVIFGLVMFIVACIIFNSANLKKANFPADKDGHICMLQPNSKGQLRPYVYFSDLSDPMNNRYCVQDCPESGIASQCLEAQCNLGYYPNYASTGRLGAMCLPEDQTARQKLIQDTQFFYYEDGAKAIQILLIVLGISFGIGIIWMILVYCFPRAMVWVAFILATALLILTAVLFFVDDKTSLSTANKWNIPLGILALIFALALIIYMILNHKNITYSSIFLKNASLVIKQKCTILLYIPLFIILTFLFGILIVFQYLAFSSSTNPYFEKSQLYWKLWKSFWFMAPLVIQTLWGLSFLRDAFNFCVSGVAVQWYFRKDIQLCYPLKAFITKHFGSVAGGSFLRSFMFIPHFFVDLFCNHRDACCCNCCDLPRGDAYPYLYMTSTSYCPSVRQAQYLCKRSDICRGNQSTNFYYSLAARLVLALSSTLIAYWILQSNMYHSIVNPYVLLGTFLIGVFITSYFIDIHVDIAEALMISFLAQHEADMNYLEMDIARTTLKNEINGFDMEIYRKQLENQAKKQMKH